jgi:hypothetical protein
MVKIGVDLTGAQKGLKQAAKEFKSTGNELTSIGKNMTMGITAPIMAAAGASVKLASDLEETMNKVNVVFGDSADTVKSWAKSSVTSMGLAQQTAMDMTSTMGDMATSMGFSSAESAKLGMELTKRAADMASFKNISIDIANTALASVFTGETESLKKMGVVMTEANLQQYALSKGIKTTIKDMTQAEKVQLRYNYVMEKTSNAAGDFVRTQGGVANQSRIVTESLKELGATMGQALIPVTKDLLKGVNSMLKGFISLTDEQKKTILTLAGIAAAMGPVILIIGKLSTGIGGVITGLVKAGKALKDGGGLIAGLGALIGPAGVVVLVVAALAALAYGLMALTKDSREATAEVRELTRACEDSEKAFREQVSATDTEATAARSLADQLYKLESKQNKTNAETTRMTSLVAQLNNIMPDLNLTIDEQTGLLSQNRDEVFKLIKAKKDQLKLEAYEIRLVELYKEKVELADQMADAQKRLTKATEEFNKQRLIGFIWEEIGETSELRQARIAVDLLTASVSDNENQIKSAEWAYDGLASTYVDLGTTVEETSETIVESSEESSKAILAQIDAQHEAYDTYMKDLEAKTEEHINQMGAIDQKGIEQNKLSAKQVKKNLEAQIRDFQNWRENIKKLSARVPTDVMDELNALGPQFTPMIKDLTKMTDEKLAEWVGVWQQRGKLAADTAKSEIDPLPEDLAGVAALAADRFAEGMSNEEKLKIIETAATEMAEAAKPKVNLYPTGQEAAQGFLDGLKSKDPTIRKAAAQMGIAVKGGLSQYLEIKSPSKVMDRLGAYSSQGFVSGLMGGLGEIKRASGLMSDALTGINTPAASFGLTPGASGDSPAKTGNRNINVNITFGDVSMKSDADIYGVSKKLARQITREMQAQGV